MSSIIEEIIVSKFIFYQLARDRPGKFAAFISRLNVKRHVLIRLLLLQERPEITHRFFIRVLVAIIGKDDK